MPKTKERYLHAVDRWCEFAGADPIGWTRERASAFYAQLLGTGMKAASANVVMAGVQYASKWWAHQQADPNADFAKIEQAKNEVRDQQDALTDNQAQALLETTRLGSPLDLRDRALIVLALETGMRVESLQSVNLERIVVKGYPLVPVKLKGQSKHEPYEVPLTDTALLGMQPWRAWLKDNGIGSGPMFRRLFAGLTAKGLKKYEPGPIALSSVSIWEIVTKRAARAKLDHVHPHMFRHTFVTSRSGQITEFQIASVTGHKLSQYGQLSTYANRHELGGQAREYTPSWLIDWCERVCR